jgi:hypothetical protein
MPRLARQALFPVVVALLLPSLVLAQDAGRLTSASNVRVRTEPVESATVVVTLPLGTSLVGVETGGEDRAWLRVRTGDGQEGWVLTRLTRRFDAEKRLDVVEQIVAERVGRKGDSLAARVEVVGLVERSIAETTDAERAGRLALLWIQAMRGAASSLPAKHRLTGSSAAWVESQKSAVWWNEVGANWLLSLDKLQELHQEHRTTSSADAIAWSMVENGLGGECEGYLPCYVERANLLEGEYLRRHPNGRRVDDAVAMVEKATAFWLTRLDKPDAFSPDKDCEELKESLTPLRAAVAATKAAGRDDTLAKLDVLNRKCGGTDDEPVFSHASTPAPQAATPSAGPTSPSAPVPVAAAGTGSHSRTFATSLFALAGVALVTVAGIVMLRRRTPPPSNRITLS